MKAPTNSPTPDGAVPAEQGDSRERPAPTTKEKPMNAPARFKQVDLTRAVRGVEKAGMRVGRVEIMPDGRIMLSSTEASEPVVLNPWDEDLPR